VIDGLVSVGLPPARKPDEALEIITGLLAKTTLPALPNREVWPIMAGSTAANWHFLRGRVLAGLGRKDEALAEFRLARGGGKFFAAVEIACLGGGGDETMLRPAIEAGSGLACGLVASALPRVSGAAGRQRLLEICELGIRRGDSLSFIVMSVELVRQGRRKEAAAFLRRLEREPIPTRWTSSKLEYDALVAIGQRRAAMRLGRRMSRLGLHWRNDARGFLEDCFKDDPDLTRVFVLLELEKLHFE
jgi:hypothetical protein